MRRPRPKVDETVDESAESEITILPDGRVFAFGITGPLAAVLATIPTADERTRRLLERIGRLGAGTRPYDPSTRQERKECPTERG
jgi:hypothetical protein